MELRQLEVFLVVADELHFARASERLHLAQSSVSSIVAAIERELGGPVFDRSSRRVTLTPAGRLLVEHATEVVGAMEETVRSVRALIDGTGGEVRLGYSFAAVFCLEVLTERVRTELPSLTLSPIELYGPLAHRALLDGEIDLALIWFAQQHPDLVAVEVARRPFVALLGHDHPLAGADEVTLSDLADEEFVLSPRTQNPDFYDAIGQRCETAGFTPRVRQHVGGFRSVRTVIAVAGGVGMTVDTATADVDLGETVAVPLAAVEPAPLSIVMQRNAATAARNAAALMTPVDS